MGQERDEGSALQDEFDDIRARVDRIRREAQQRIDALRDPTGLDVRLPPRPGSRPAPRPLPPPAAAPEVTDRPLPPSAAVPAPAPPPVAAPPAPGVAAPRTPAEEPRIAPVVPVRDWGAEPPRPSVPAPPVVEAPAPAAPVAEVPVGPVGRVIPVEELPPAGDGWDAPLSDVPTDRGSAGIRGVDTASARPGPLAMLRDLIERIATSRSVLVPVWQAISVVVLVAALLWVVWFPLVGGGGSQALVAGDDRMAPTVRRGDVVVITPSSDLPYPPDTVVALDAGGVVVVERIVGERVEDDVRLLVTRADGVSVGPSRDVRPDQVVGAVRRIHRMLGLPALWFDDPDAIVWRVALVLLLLASAVGAASLVVRAELRRQDRLLVSAIASGDRTPRRR